MSHFHAIIEHNGCEHRDRLVHSFDDVKELVVDALPDNLIDLDDMEFTVRVERCAGCDTWRQHNDDVRADEGDDD